MALIAPSTTRREDVLAGVHAMTPLVLAYAPFAVVIGSTVASIDEPVAGWAGSWLIYGGSAHLAALHGIADGGALLAIATALLVNARLLVYSASIAPRWRHQPRWFRALGPALLIDPTWALAERHDHLAASPAADRRFFLGAGLTLGAAWSALIAAGAAIGDRLPDVGLELAAPLCLLALVATPAARSGAPAGRHCRRGHRPADTRLARRHRHGDGHHRRLRRGPHEPEDAVMTTWLVILAVGAGSYLLRVLPIVLDGRGVSSPRFARTLGHAGTAALAALVAVGFRGAATSPPDAVATVLAAAGALVVALLGGSMLRVLLAGTAVFTSALLVTSVFS